MRRFGCSRRSAGLTRGDLGDKKLGHWRDSGARRLPRVGGGGRSHGAGGSAGAGWLTEWGVGWPRGVLGLQDWVLRPSYGRGREEARERVCERGSDERRTCSLAGHIGVCAR